MHPDECQRGSINKGLGIGKPASQSAWLESATPHFQRQQWWSNYWIAVTHVGDPDKVFGSWLWPGTAPAGVGIWEQKLMGEFFLVLPIRSLKNNIKLGPDCGTASKIATWDARIPYRHWFESWLLHFRSSSLLMHLSKQHRMAQVLVPLHPHGGPEEAPVFRLQTCSALAIVTICQVSRSKLSWDLSLSLNSAFQIF